MLLQPREPAKNFVANTSVRTKDYLLCARAGHGENEFLCSGMDSAGIASLSYRARRIVVLYAAPCVCLGCTYVRKLRARWTIEYCISFCAVWTHRTSRGGMPL